MRSNIHSNDGSNIVNVYEPITPRRNAISTPDQPQYVAPTQFEDLPIFLNADNDRSRQEQDGTGLVNSLPYNFALMQYNPGYQSPVHPPAPAEELHLRLSSPDLPVQLSYTSFEHAEISASLLHYKNAWKPPGNIPKTQQECVHWVSHLLSAMLDTSTCLENRDKGAFRKRWAPLKSGERNPYYRLEALELTCWKLLHVAMKLHNFGTQALDVYDDEALRGTKQDKQLCFAERMRAICDLLRTSKTRCDKLVKGEMMNMTVARPCNRMKSVKANKKNNESRQKTIEEGKKSRREGKELREQEQGPAMNLPIERKRQVRLGGEDGIHAGEDTPQRKRQRER